MKELRIKQVNELEQFIDNAIFIGDEPCDIQEDTLFSLSATEMEETKS